MTAQDDSRRFPAAMVARLFESAVTTTRVTDGDRPPLSVIVRTQGHRPDLLAEALLSLASQTVEDLEVLLVVHDGSEQTVADVTAGVATFNAAFADRVTILSAGPGHRGTPLNVALDRARGHYVAFLDDDDVVLANWAQVFVDEAADHPGMIIRSVTADQKVRRLRGDRPPYFVPIDRITVPPRRATFDLLFHLEENATPICAYAVPLDAVRHLGLRFEEDLMVMEDWLFLVQAALVCGVVDTEKVTAIYRRWDDDEATWHQIDDAAWREARVRIWEILDSAPLLMPPGSADAIRDLREKARRPAPKPAVDAARPPDPKMVEELKRLERERDNAARRLAQIEASRSWKMTTPIRRFLDVVRRRR